MKKMWKTSAKVKIYNLNVTEVLDSTLKKCFSTIFDFTVGILVSPYLYLTYLESPLKMLTSSGIINTFGTPTDYSNITITPYCFKKGSTSVAIYGLSHFHSSQDLLKIIQNGGLTFDDVDERTGFTKRTDTKRTSGLSWKWADHYQLKERPLSIRPATDTQSPLFWSPWILDKWFQIRQNPSGTSKIFTAIAHLYKW